MDYEITLDNLSTTSVSILTRNYVTVDSVKYYVGDPHRCAYINSTSGRTDISSALAEPYLSAVMAIWGTTPTVEEYTQS